MSRRTLLSNKSCLHLVSHVGPKQITVFIVAGGALDSAIESTLLRTIPSQLALSPSL